MEKIAQLLGIDHESLIKALDFIPYPFLLSEYRLHAQHNIFVNERFIDEIGYTCNDIPTLEDWFLTAYPDPAYRETISRQWSDLLNDAKNKGQNAIVTQARVRTKHTGNKWYEIKASVLGTVNFVVFVNIDNEIKRERELENLNDNKNRILSILSHDLRSPLNNLRAVLDLAANNVISHQEEHEMLKKISFQVFELTELLDTTLQWSKSNFSGINVGREIMTIQPIVGKYLKLYDDPIQDKHIRVIQRLSANQIITSDPEIISIVLRNLISNAIKYTTPEGTITIGESIGNNQYSINVENTGTGIVPEKIADILYGRYVSEPGTKCEKGLGLGLKLCRQLLEKIDGHLAIESPDPNKALFRIVIPTDKSD